MRESTIHTATNSSKTTPKRTNCGVIIESERLKSQELSVTSVTSIILHVTRKKLLVGWAAQNGDVVSQILQNLDSIVLVIVRALAPDSGMVINSIQGSSVLLATGGVGVAVDAVLQESSSIIECMTCIAWAAC